MQKIMQVDGIIIMFAQLYAKLQLFVALSLLELTRYGNFLYHMSQ